MKTLKNLIICLLIIMANTASATDEKFVVAMEQGIEQLTKAITFDQAQLAANHFERLASSKTTDWLPIYYAAYSNLKSGIFVSDKSKKDQLYDKAISQLNVAENLSKDNSEIFAMQGYVVLMKLAVDPPLRAMTMMPEGISLLTRARKLDPENPRIYLIEGQFMFYKPEEFGGGKAKAKPILQEGLKRYAVQHPVSTIVPSWGKQRLEDLLKMCE